MYLCTYTHAYTHIHTYTYICHSYPLPLSSTEAGKVKKLLSQHPLQVGMVMRTGSGQWGIRKTTGGLLKTFFLHWLIKKGKALPRERPSCCHLFLPPPCHEWEHNVWSCGRHLATTGDKDEDKKPIYRQWHIRTTKRALERSEMVSQSHSAAGLLAQTCPVFGKWNHQHALGDDVPGHSVAL